MQRWSDFRLKLFYKKVEEYRKKYPSLRKGQVIMNVLKEFNPVFYDEIQQSEYDCFYDDSKIPLLYHKIKEFFEY